jgi:methylmalonyl-CoA/ethylmalonyl-CoA epimerase
MKGIAHIGIAVKDLKKSKRLFEQLLGVPPDHEEMVEGQKVRIAMFEVGGSHLELTEALDSTSPIARFIEKRGEGIHHISLEVDDIHTELLRLSRLGFVSVDPNPRDGAGNSLVAFLHPKSTNGVLVELCQKKPG